MKDIMFRRENALKKKWTAVTYTRHNIKLSVWSIMDSITDSNIRFKNHCDHLQSRAEKHYFI